MPGTKEDLQNFLLAIKKGNLAEVQNYIAARKIAIHNILIAREAFACALMATCELNEGSIAALDAIANLILDAVPYKQAQKKMILMGEANVSETLALLYATEKGMMNTAIRLINDFKVPYNVVLDPLHIAPRPDLNTRFRFPDGANALEVAIAHDHLPLVTMFLCGYIWQTAPVQAGSAFATTYRLTLGKPLEVEPWHLELAIKCGASFSMLEKLYLALSYEQRLEFFQHFAGTTILKTILKRKHKTIDANGSEVFLPRKCDSEAAIYIIDKRWIQPSELTKCDGIDRTFIFDAVHGSAAFVAFILEYLNSLKPGRSFATKADLQGITPMAYAANVGGLPAMAVLVKYGASVADIHPAEFLSKNYVFAYLDVKTRKEIVVSGSILQFAALCKYSKLLTAILALSADHFPVAAREEQLKTVIEYIRSNDSEYADVLDILNKAGLQLDPVVVQEEAIEDDVAAEVPQVMQVMQDETQSLDCEAEQPKRKPSMFWSFGRCFGAVPSSASPTPSSTRASSPVTEPPTPGRMFGLLRVVRTATPIPTPTPTPDTVGPGISVTSPVLTLS